MDSMDLVPSTWYQVLGTKYLVPSAGYQVLGTKYLIPSTWHQVLGTTYLVPGTWYQVLGTKHLASLISRAQSTSKYEMFRECSAKVGREVRTHEVYYI